MTTGANRPHRCFGILVAVGRVHSAQHLLEMIANESVAIAGARWKPALRVDPAPRIMTQLRQLRRGPAAGRPETANE